MKNSLIKKVILLNQTILDTMLEENELEIIKKFTESGIEILNADFGFAWWKFKKEYKLAYKSPNTPFNARIPLKKNSSNMETRMGRLYYEENVKKGAYKFDIDKHIKSYIIVPVSFGENIYGTLVFCYKKKHNFTEEELGLADLIGNISSQARTINWLIESEHDRVELAAKQKTTEALLLQEKLKTEFIANAAHELRTPLAIIRGNADLVLMGKSDLKSAKEALVEINGEIKRLASILQDLELVTTENKNYNPIKDFSKVDINILLSSIAKRLSAVSRERKITIKFTPTREKNCFVYGEEKFLEKLFLNLTKNAITYGKKNGFIDINLCREKSTIKVEIADNGIGISKEDLPHVFERFYRADKSHSGIHSGLGLAIAKWVVEKHKGTIGVASTLGKGTKFTIKLPALEND